jgi:hypothetical protein
MTLLILGVKVGAHHFPSNPTYEPEPGLTELVAYYALKQDATNQ